NDISQARTPETDPSLAQQVYPVVLEEWIHMFQHQIEGYLSEGTYQFLETPEVVQNQMLPDGQGRWNMREVDIYAVYRDLGWDQVVKTFQTRYTEREKYANFLENVRRFNLQRLQMVSRGRRGVRL